MKTLAAKWSGWFCRHRFAFAVVMGLGVGWSMSKSLGVGTGFAIGGAVTLAMLSRKSV
jgi:hypothetical protein